MHRMAAYDFSKPKKATAETPRKTRKVAVSVSPDKPRETFVPYIGKPKQPRKRR
jgi:hypothetical protein